MALELDTSPETAEVVAADRALAEAEQRVRDARRVRDEAIRALHAQRWSPGKIGRAIGMSTSNVRLIIERQTRA